MKIMEIFFILVAFNIMTILFVADQTEVVIVFPTLDTPTFPEFNFTELHTANFTDLSAGCGGFTDCIEYLGEVIRNIGEIFRIGIDIFFNLIEAVITFVQIVFVTVLFIFDLIIFLFEIFALIFSLSLDPASALEGAPWFVNLLVFFPYTAAAGLILYKMIRKGETSD